MARPARIAVLVNSTAGRGQAEAVGEAFASCIRESGAQAHVHVPDSVPAARSLTARTLASRPDALAIVGGDGTLAAVLDQVLGSDVPIVLVPAGTGNDLARALGQRDDGIAGARRAARLAVAGTPRAVDVGLARCPDGAAHFLTIAAMGFDANVSERTGRLRWSHGTARYVLALLIELVRLRPLRFTITNGADTRARVAPGILLAVGNTRSYGGGLPMCPDADPSDGLLDVTHVAPIGRMRLLRLFPRLLAARHLSLPVVDSWRTGRITVAAPGLVVHVDGERLGTGSVTVTVVPGALRVLASSGEITTRHRPRRPVGARGPTTRGIPRRVGPRSGRRQPLE